MTATPANDTLIKAKTVYTAAGTPISPGAVLVRNGKIVQVAANIDANNGLTVIDLKDGVVVPGLVNLYDASGVAGGGAEVTLEIAPSQRMLRAIDWRSREFRESLADGVTTIGVFPTGDCVVGGKVAAVKTAGEVGPARILKANAGLTVALCDDPSNRNMARMRPDTLYVRQPTNRMGVVWLLRNTFDKAQRRQVHELADIGAALAGRQPIFALSRTDYDIEGMLRIADEFKFKPVIVGGHEAHKLADRLAAGKIPVALGAIGTGVGQMFTGDGALDAFWNRAGVLHNAGVTLALTGDRLLDQARFAVRFGLPKEAALAAITRTPAELLGVGDRVGTIAAGKDADLVALGGEPWELTTPVRWVMVGGHVVSGKAPASNGPGPVASGRTKTIGK